MENTQLQFQLKSWGMLKYQQMNHFYNSTK